MLKLIRKEVKKIKTPLFKEIVVKGLSGRITINKFEMQNHKSLHSQLALPFRETDSDHLIDIFTTLENKFGLQRNSNQTLVDLGAGNGKIIIFSALHYGLKSIGIEINSTFIAEAKNRIAELRKKPVYPKKMFQNIQLEVGDLFSQNIQKFDFIYIYGLPTMHKYLNHVFQTAKKGAIIISYKYPIDIFKTYLVLEYKLLKKARNQKFGIFFYRKV